MTGNCCFCGDRATAFSLSQGDDTPMYSKHSFLYKICGKCAYTRSYLRKEVANIVVLRIKKEI